MFRKQAAVWLQDQYRISGRRACRMVCLSSSMYYYRHQPREDTNLRLRIRDIALSRVRCGFWRIFVLLRREGFTDNHKRVYRVYKEEGLNLRSKRPRRSRSAAHRLQRLDTPAINRVWSMDFVQDALFNGSRFRILAIVRYSDDSTPPFRCKVHHFFCDKKGVSQSIPLAGDSVIQT